MRKMFDDEELLPLLTAAEQATGQRPHLSTIIRWHKRGINGVRLEAYRLGNRWLSSAPAVIRFMESVTAQVPGAVAQPGPTPRQQTRAAISAAQKLAERLK